MDKRTGSEAQQRVKLQTHICRLRPPFLGSACWLKPENLCDRTVKKLFYRSIGWFKTSSEQHDTNRTKLTLRRKTATAKHICSKIVQSSFFPHFRTFKKRVIQWHANIWAPCIVITEQQTPKVSLCFFVAAINLSVLVWGVFARSSLRKSSSIVEFHRAGTALLRSVHRFSMTVEVRRQWALLRRALAGASVFRPLWFTRYDWDYCPFEEAIIFGILTSGVVSAMKYSIGWETNTNVRSLLPRAAQLNSCLWNSVPFLLQKHTFAQRSQRVLI